jgi:hypothetical protein
VADGTPVKTAEHRPEQAHWAVRRGRSLVARGKPIWADPRAGTTASGGTAMWPHLTTWEFLLVVTLLALRELPAWLSRFVRFGDELRRFRTHDPRHHPT